MKNTQLKTIIFEINNVYAVLHCRIYDESNKRILIDYVIMCKVITTISYSIFNQPHGVTCNIIYIYNITDKAAGRR